MERKFQELTDVVETGEEYRDFLDTLLEDINDLDIPNWMLIPKRASGEHATGNAWMGVVLSACSGQDESATVETRIAIDTEGRARVRSNVGSVPDEIREPIESAMEKAEKDVEMCVARITYEPESRTATDISLLLKFEEEEE